MSAKLVFPGGAAPAALQPAVDAVLERQQCTAIPAAPQVFVRITALKTILNEHGQLVAGSRLANPSEPPNTYCPPASFVTIPETISEFSWYAMLTHLGYTSGGIDDLLRGGPAAAIIFKYPDSIRSLVATDGNLDSGADSRVVRATWQNVFRTFKDLAKAESTAIPFADDDRRFVASFPSWGRERLMGESYAHIEGEGGADWRYRWLLREFLWITPSFIGEGWGADANGGRGAPEYLGPNIELATLADEQRLAIVSL